MNNQRLRRRGIIFFTLNLLASSGTVYAGILESYQVRPQVCIGAKATRVGQDYQGPIFNSRVVYRSSGLTTGAQVTVIYKTQACADDGQGGASCTTVERPYTAVWIAPDTWESPIFRAEADSTFDIKIKPENGSWFKEQGIPSGYDNQYFSFGLNVGDLSTVPDGVERSIRIGAGEETDVPLRNLGSCDLFNANIRNKSGLIAGDGSQITLSWSRVASIDANGNYNTNAASISIGIVLTSTAQHVRAVLIAKCRPARTAGAETENLVRVVDLHEGFRNLVFSAAAPGLQIPVRTGELACRHEIAIVRDGRWLVDPVNGTHNFRFQL